MQFLIEKFLIVLTVLVSQKNMEQKKIKFYRSLLSTILLTLKSIKYLILALRADWSSDKNRAIAPHLQHLLAKKSDEIVP